MHKPVVIIGGGLAGLYAAYNLKKRDIPFLLLEAKASLGGRIASHYLPTNNIAFPKDVPVTFKLTSDNIMNAFFIPRLGSQIYAMPGMVTKLNLIANHEAF